MAQFTEGNCEELMKHVLRFFPLILLTAGFSFAQTQFIGVSTIEASLDNNSAGQAEAFLTTATAAGSVATITVYLNDTNSAKTVFVGIYSNSSGHPNALLGAGTIAAPVAGAWNTAAISPAVRVTAGTAYHIALLGTGGTIQFSDTANGTHSENSSQTNLTSLPETWSSGSSWPSGPASAYGSGTAGSIPSSGVQISISPSTATVNEGGTQQFVATVTGTSNTAVNWSVLSGTGTISSSGLFKAPNSQESEAVQVRSQADSTKIATASVTVPPISIQIQPMSANVAPGGTQQFTATVSGTVTTGVKWTETGKGTINQSGLYTAPPTNETDTVVATAVAGPSPSADATVSVQQVSSTACGNTLNWTNSLCQQIGSGALNSAYANYYYSSAGGTNVFAKDPHAWAVISRHGEYAQNENECNVPGAISAGSGLLVVKTWKSSYTCGDFNPTTGNPCSGAGTPCPGSFPYQTGDIEWNTFNFTYGTLEWRGTFPNTNTGSSGTGTWPAVWMLAGNCQSPNKYTGDPGTGGCPNFGQTGYDEIDLLECYLGACGTHVYHNNSGVMCPINEYANEIHTWWMSWTPGNITMAMDGVNIPGCSWSTNISSQPMYLIIQTQTAPSAEGPPTDANLPTQISINYVKVCNKNVSASACSKEAWNGPDVIFYDAF